MSEIQTITNIRTTKNSIREKLKTLNCQAFLNQQFGDEQEYNCKELYAELDEILTDITTLTKKPKQFLKLSNHEERNSIYNELTNIDNTIEDPDHVVVYLDKLKVLIRQFHIKYTNDRFVEFDAELSELTAKKQTFSVQLKKLEESLSKTLGNGNKSKGILESLQKQQNELDESIESTISVENNLRQKIENFNSKTKHMSEIEQQIESKKATIDDFVKKIVNRDQELEEQTVKTDIFSEKLKQFTTEREELLQTAEDLIKEAKTALGYKKAEGIAAAFRNRLQKLEPEEAGIWKKLSLPSVLWLIGAIAFAAGAMFLSYEFIEAIQKEGEMLSFNIIFARLSALALPIAGAWFCAGQYTKIKNIAEDYAYKTVLVESMIGFSEHLKNDNDMDVSYQNYMIKILDEIHRHPLQNHKKQEDDNLHTNLMNKIETLIKSNKKDET